MWQEFYLFDLRYQLRQPLFWVTAIIFSLLALGLGSAPYQAIGAYRNTPSNIAFFLNLFSVFSMLNVASFIAGTVLRDREVGIADMIFAIPIRKFDYLFGRFLAAITACIFIFVAVSLGFMLGPLMPWVDPTSVGPFSLYPYIWSIFILMLPNLFLIGSLFILIAVTTQSIRWVYIGILVFLVLWMLTGVLTIESNRTLSNLLEPFGSRSFYAETRSFNASQANNELPALAGDFLENRLLWFVVAVIFFLMTLVLFKPERDNKYHAGIKKQKIKTLTYKSASPKIVSMYIGTPSSSAVNAVAQCWRTICFDTAGILRSLPFLVMVGVCMIGLIGVASQNGIAFNARVYPVTQWMLQAIFGTFGLLLPVIITYYAGELIFKEREANVSCMVDTMPFGNGTALVAKCASLVFVILGFLLAGVVTSAAFQLVRGGVPLEPLLYLKGLLIGSVYFSLLGLFAIALQVIINNKYIGYLFVILAMLNKKFLDFLGFDHNLYSFGGLPSLQYSDMNGYGDLIFGWSWFALYWTVFVLATLTIAYTFWVRGVPQNWSSRLRIAAKNLHGKTGVILGLFLIAFALTGSWIFFNTNILNIYSSGGELLDERANYEKRYRKYKAVTQPRLTDIRANVDIFPDERRLEIDGHYTLENKTLLELDTLFIDSNSKIQTTLINLPPHRVEIDDRTLGVKIIKFSPAIAPGERFNIDFKVIKSHSGFSNDGKSSSINLNGTFFNSEEFFPRIGYNSANELSDASERLKQGLGKPNRMNLLEDKVARSNMELGVEADFVNFETTVSTNLDQTAIAPGELLDTWEKNGRRYFHYKMDQPMLPYFSYLSAKLKRAMGDWNGIAVEVYFDEKHDYNVTHMIEAVKKSLEYFTVNFGPYQYKQLRIIEFPQYSALAQSFAGTIPYSEALGFISDLRTEGQIDPIFYITAHEVSHQWWGNQVIGADAQGSSMLSESLAQYSAIMVMEKKYGKEYVRKILKAETEQYFAARKVQPIEELPLSRVDRQQGYISYNKGILVFYRLRNEIGEENLNRILRRYLQSNSEHRAPYPTTKEFLDYVYSETPLEKHALLTDLFNKVVTYDNRIIQASAKQRPDKKWDVTINFHVGKFELDGHGVETTRIYDEPVQLSIFSRASDGKEHHLASQRIVPQGSDSIITITVKERPLEVMIDPDNAMINKASEESIRKIIF